MQKPNETLSCEYVDIGFTRISQTVWISDKDAGHLPYIDGWGRTHKFDIDYLYDCNEFYAYLDYHDENNIASSDAESAKMPRWLVMM